MGILLALGWFEIAVFSILFIALLIAAGFDRDNQNSYVWTILFLFLAFYAIMHWSNLSFNETIDAILSIETLTTALKYLAIGAIYSIVEFRFVVKEAAVYFSGIRERSPKENLNGMSYLFVDVKQDHETNAIKPNVNKGKLVDNLSAWTILWPIYMINMLIGKFVVRAFTFFSEVVISYSRNYVNNVFNKEFGGK